MSSGVPAFDFPYIHFGVPAPSPDVRLAFIPVHESRVYELARNMRQKLAQGPPPVPKELEKKLGPHDVPIAPTLFPQIDLPGYPPLHGAIDRFGQTAIMVHWLHRMTIEVATKRPNGIVQAVSLYLTGLDRDADNGVMAAAADRRFGPQRVPLPLNKEAWKKIAEGSRPLAVQIFLQQLAWKDPSIRCAFLALGMAFFGTLGVGDEPGEKDEG